MVVECCGADQIFRYSTVAFCSCPHVTRPCYFSSSARGCGGLETRTSEGLIEPDMKRSRPGNHGTCWSFRSHLRFGETALG